MTKEQYEKIKEEMDSGEFIADNWAGGNIDDAFYLGYEFGQAEAEYEEESK